MTLEIANSAFVVRVSRQGAELRGLYVRTLEADLLWQGDGATWAGTAPLCFPITGRAPKGVISSAGREFSMDIHGFAKDSLFDVLEHGPDYCRLRLCDDVHSRAQYPYSFALTVDYRICATGLAVEVMVENTGGEDLPFAFGFHPGFAYPLPQMEGRRHDLWLDAAVNPQKSLLSEGFLTGLCAEGPFVAGRMEVSDRAFLEDSSLVFADPNVSRLVYGAQGGYELELSWQGLEQLVLWRPVAANFLCLEPWCGLPPHKGATSALAERPYIQYLPRGRRQRFAMCLAVKGLNL